MTGPERSRAKPKPGYEVSVFINCPFDHKYKTVFNAVVFAVYDAGFYPRCAFELGDASQFRLQGITQIIQECKYGIHDVSRTQLDRNRLPRFNMPLELGIFLGCKYFGGNPHQLKSCLVLDSEQYRYQKFISDLAGQDVYAHNDEPKRAVFLVRDWLRQESERIEIPDGQVIWRRFGRFQRRLPTICKRLKWNPQILKLKFVDYRYGIYDWLQDNAL